MHVTVSLPDLVSGKRRNSTLSLSEGFAGARHRGALAATAQNFAPRANLKSLGAGGSGAPAMGRVLPIYYRTRQFVLTTEKAGRRVPARMQADLRAQEKELAQELRQVHPLLFQRFDDLQLDRLLRAMPFLRLSQDRWVFGGGSAAWPSDDGRAFLLLSGRVALFPDPGGGGEMAEALQGAVFGERGFRLGDEALADGAAGAARCEEPCIVGILSPQVLEAAFADRAIGNRRIAQLVKQVPALARITQPDPSVTKQTGRGEPQEAERKESNAVTKALEELSKVATAVHVAPGQEILSDEPLEESVLIVSSGGVDVRCDVTLTEKLEAIPPKPVRIRIQLDRAERLAGDSILDKLDPYCVVKLGDFKRFQTPVQWNVGPNPRFDYSGVLMFGGEELLEFTVMDHDKFSADDLCGSGSIPVKELHDGWSGRIDLTRPKRGVFRSEETLEEPAGRLHFSVRWDYERVTAMTRKPKQRTWADQDLFNLGKDGCWGHEQLILGGLFRRTLEQASQALAYSLELSNFRVFGSAPRGGNDVVTCWKASRRRFTDFLRHCGRERHFMQACRVSSLEKQSHVQELAVQLIRKWELEEQTHLMRAGMLDAPPAEEAIDASRFRVAYRGCRATISVRNALNLTGGGWFDKLDPYAKLRFQNSKEVFTTSVLQDAGSDPVWNAEGTLEYNGETALEIVVWDYDGKYNPPDKIATGVIQVEQFCSGFEGMVPLTKPGSTKKTRNIKQMMIVVGIQWGPPRDPSAAAVTNLAALTGMRTLAQAAA
mmetsp:Transcript_81495/g.230929  ORF Transcript_81495/g.230929 Transcript_81495/m.230929 type:complete len:771 (+) Transcript_81495:246-2558(+)